VAPYVWSFTAVAAPPAGPLAVNLGTAANFAILSKSTITTTGVTSITGNIAVSPAAATFITGFGLVADASNVFSTSSLLTGQAFAANYAPPTPANLTTAVSDMQAAYTDAAGRTAPDTLNTGAGSIGGTGFAPGLHKWTTAVNIASNITLTGGANDVFIFQITGDLTLATSQSVILAGGAQAKNIFWQVAGQVTLGTGTVFNGNILCQTSITLQTGATVNGRLLAQTGVPLDAATVVKP
jgi:hypothetical protein